MKNRTQLLILGALLLISVAATASTIGTTTASPNSTPVGQPLLATVTAVITDPGLIPDSVNLQRLDASGRVLAVIGNLHDDGQNGDATAGDHIYSIQFTVLENAPGQVRVRVSAGFTGQLLRVFSTTVLINITGTTATDVSIGSPASGAYLNTSPVLVTGSVGDRNATVYVNGIQAAVIGNSFQATVPLMEGPNTLAAVANNTNGTTTTASRIVTLDTTPPHVTIYSPTDSGTTSDGSVTVTGLVNDIVVGTVNPQQATVSVNGIAAQVINRSFTALNVPLALGQNTIQATGVDRAGNGATATVHIMRQPATVTSLRVYSGNNQSAPIATKVAQPLVAQLLDGSGHPLAGVPVVFRITSGDGNVSPSTAPGVPSVAVNTDATGFAKVNLTVGSRAGAGNNAVEASTTGVASTALFTASATSTGAAMVLVDTGNNQYGVVGQALPLPFVAVVTDRGYNRIGNVPVTFTVRSGNGLIAGKTTYTANTDSDGRVSAILTLGTEPGVSNNLVEANFAGNTGFAAAFTATAQLPGPADATAISGVVLDNANQPLQGVTMRLFSVGQGNMGNVPQELVPAVQTDPEGQFVIQPVPVGVFKLMADGSTAQSPNTYPTLEYDVVTVPGQNNTLGLPIYLPQLNVANRVCVDETHGGTLTIPQAPGFSLTVLPGSATFPGGSRSGCVSVTPVNMDKVPMAPGFGQQPRFIVTIQPVGTRFNPPAPMTIPNVDGLAPRAKTEMYSYDHDLASFVAIGTGTVSDDGSVISSDPGVGVLKAGWHCGGNPNSSGSAGTCPSCKKCQGNNCVADSGQNGQMVTDNKCKVCQNGNQVDIPLDPTESSVSVQFGLPNDTVSKLNETLEELKDIGIIASVNLLQITGTLKTKECCGPETGKGHETTGSVSGNFGGFNVEGKIWPPGPIPSIDVTVDVFGVVSVEAKAEFIGGVFLGLKGEVTGEVGYRKSECEKEEADRNGCFYAKLNTTLTPSATAKIGGAASLSFDCIFCVKETIAGEATLILGQFSWPINISSISYHDPKCTDGLQGGLFQPQDGKFVLSVEIKGSYTPEGGVSRTYSYSHDFVSCTINLHSITCETDL